MSHFTYIAQVIQQLCLHNNKQKAD